MYTPYNIMLKQKKKTMIFKNRSLFYSIGNYIESKPVDIHLKI